MRRKGSCMPTDVLSGPLLRDVDWRASLLLNIVLQTSFSLTVSTCGCRLSPHKEPRTL